MQRKKIIILRIFLVCALGTLSPPTIQCGTGARRSREEYLGEIEYVYSNPNMSGLVSSAGRLDSENLIVENGAYAKHSYGRGKDCNIPRRVEDAMVYR